MIWIHRNVTEHYEKLDVNGRNGLWAIIALGNGKYRLVSKSNGYYVDLANGICENGHNICMVRYIEGEAQEWEFIPCEEPKPDILLGDLYKDDKLSIMDIIVLQRHLVNLDTISEAQSTLADMNSDGTVDIFDLALLKHAVLS